MIPPFWFPFLRGVLLPMQAPMTWFLIMFNFFIFLSFYPEQRRSQQAVEKFIDKESFIMTQGQMFAQFIRDESVGYSDLMKKLSVHAIEKGDEKKVRFLGQLALRDVNFMKYGVDHIYKGDEVMISRWKSDFSSYVTAQNDNFNYKWGLTHGNATLLNWFSYQFVHGDAFHVLNNMVFLLIFGGAIELTIGPAVLLLVYLGSGMLAAIAFLMMSGLSAVPLVGASGSISGLIGVFAAMNWKKPVAFFYCLLPSPRYVGFVFLPAWVAVANWLILDFAGYFGKLSEMGGTAHAAHLGGAWIGLLMGFLFLRWGKPAT
jgi:membrane associated rhomboid family serine protease